MFCLPPDLGDKFLSKIADGTIDANKLAKMTSKERHAFFEKQLGKENATSVNSLFESKLLLKNQQLGFTTWARKVAGITPEVRRDLISRIQKLDHILSEEDEKKFLHDLASTKLGVDVTHSEAMRIATLSKKISANKDKVRNDGTFNSETERLNYGRSIVDLDNYVQDLKTRAGGNIVQKLKDSPRDTILSAPSKTAGLAKSLKATLDNSVIGRQGLKTAFTHPTVWARNSLKTFQDAWKELGGKNAMDEVKADVLSRPNAINGLYKKEKLATGTIEEAFPSTLPERIPGLGRVFKASESAFTGFQYRTRADIFDKYVEIANKSGADIQGIGKLANSLTGRGDLGKVEPIANSLNNIFFSPRLLKSNIDTLSAHLLDKNIGTFARKRAALNTLKIITGIGAVLALAEAIRPGSVEWDPRSSDYGKIKIGNTRFDVTGGMSSLVTLASRAGPLVVGKNGYVKNSSTGQLKKLGSGVGQQNGTDLIYSFAENKLSPAASVIKDMLKGQDFNGNKPTVPGEAKNLLLPLPISTYQELKSDPKAANNLAAMISDGLGISTNTYGKTTTKWDPTSSAKLAGFSKTVGKDKFEKANQDFNEQYDKWFSDHNKNIRSLPDSEKQSLVSSAKSRIQDNVLKKYGYSYKRSNSSNQKKKLLQTIR